MGKKVWVGAVFFVSVSALAGFFYANHHAEQLMAEHIELSNKQYLELAEQGDMPPVQFSYGKLSANVLTSTYKIQDLRIAIAGMGDLLSVGQLELTGIELQGLADKGSAQVQNLRLAPQALTLLPPALAEYVSALPVELSYQYQYKAKTGELTFGQDLQIDQRFSLNYRFALTGASELWQFAEELQKLTPEQQQQLADKPEYLSDLMKKVSSIGVASGSFEIKNNGFVQQLLDQLAAAQVTHDYANTQQQLTAALQHNPQIPESIRVPVLDFVQQPERLTLSFKFKEVPTFAKIQDGSAMENVETAEDFIKFAGLTLSAN